MGKPTLFFSHSSRDAEVIGKIKEEFVSKTGGSINVFLSSDGQSIPLGRNWVHRLQEALEDARIMVVFVTPNALRSDWIYFEAGFSYAKGIRVIPVGFLGIDLSSVRPPLSLLQGFKIDSADGLNNVIAVANEEFDHTHPTSFTEEDYQAIIEQSGSVSQTLLGPVTPHVRCLSFFITKEVAKHEKPRAAQSAVEEMLRSGGVDFASSGKSVDLHGASVVFPDKDEGTICIHIEPTAAHAILPTVADVLREIHVGGLNDAMLVIDFLNTVSVLKKSFEITGRLRNDVQFDRKGGLIFRGSPFVVERRPPSAAAHEFADAVYLGVTITDDTFPEAVVRDLVGLLFDRGVLYPTEMR